MTEKPTSAADDFTSLGLEDLAEVQVSSLGRKRASLFTSPIAATLLTEKDLERTGATDLASALRWVPGLQVARADSYTVAITARGFSDLTSNKLLALSDGRAIYDPVLSGAQWGYESPFLADVLRIEVLRGPGASLWGSNAMNGVVNIVSKSAHETLGGYASAGVGTELERFGAARYGWRLNPSTAVRFYAQEQARDEVSLRQRSDQTWSHGLAGLRLDWERGDGAVLTVFAEMKRLRQQRAVRLADLFPPYEVEFADARRGGGGFMMVRWEQPWGDQTDFKTHVSYDRYYFQEFLGTGSRTTWDFDSTVSHRWKRHEFMAGLSYRRYSGHATSSPWTQYSRSKLSRDFLGAFCQDEVVLVEKRLNAVVGAKIERNSDTGWEFQPTARLTWTPSSRQTWWAAISRSARTPSTLERSLTLFNLVTPPTDQVPVPTAIYVLGRDTVSSEHQVSYEVGHRLKLGSSLSFDTSVFYNDYFNLRGIRKVDALFLPTPTPHVTLDALIGNTTRGETKGGELALRWEPRERWQVNVSYARVTMALVERADSPVPFSSIDQVVGDTPESEWKLHLGLPVGDAGSLDLFGRFADSLNSPLLASYWTVDARFAWRFDAHWKLEVGGRDLTDPAHRELSQYIIGYQPREIARTVYGRVTFQF